MSWPALTHATEAGPRAAYADPQFEASAQAARDARPEDLTPVPGWPDRR